MIPFIYYTSPGAPHPQSIEIMLAAACLILRREGSSTSQIAEHVQVGDEVVENYLYRIGFPKSDGSRFSTPEKAAHMHFIRLDGKVTDGDGTLCGWFESDEVRAIVAARVNDIDAKEVTAALARQISRQPG